MKGADSARGREQTEKDDFTFPRLAIAQSNSPQRKKSQPVYIEGLLEGHLFDTLKGVSYGEAVRLIPVRMDKRAMEFFPRKEDGSAGGIKDRNVPWNDDRCEFHGEEKPKAERFYDFLSLVAVDGRLEPIVLSMSRTNFKVGKQFNGLIGLAGGDMFSCAYTITTKERSEGSLTWFVYDVTTAGWSTDAEYKAAEALFNQMKGKSFETERETPDDLPTNGADDTDFPPADEAGESRVPGEDDV